LILHPRDDEIHDLTELVTQRPEWPVAIDRVVRAIGKRNDRREDETYENAEDRGAEEAVWDAKKHRSTLPAQ
jgi:hypothetical protein